MRAIVIGGGVAGLSAALHLSGEGADVTLIEREAQLGGKLRMWHNLFPGYTPASEVVDEMLQRLEQSDVEVRLEAQVQNVEPHEVVLASGLHLACDCVILATGYSLFDARLKEEYGYGLYSGVYTSVDIERMLRTSTLPTKPVERIAILHCVGSRDEKVQQRHCSRLCCMTGVKQAIELREAYPTAEIFNFYMDMRMFGSGYEELYRHAQEHCNIHFIRGRISEAAQAHDGRVQIKAEDTLTGHPLRMSVDMFILLIGMRADNLESNLEHQPSGFLKTSSPFANSTLSSRSGIFLAGCVSGAKSISESINEGVTAATEALKYLKCEAL